MSYCKMSRRDVKQGSPVYKIYLTNKTHHVTCDMSQVLFDMLHDITCPGKTHWSWPSQLLRAIKVISVHFQSPVLSGLLLHIRLAPELVTGTVKKSKLLGATVSKHRADQQQTKSFVYIWCSSCPKIFVCCCSALCFKTVAPSSLLFLTVPVTSMGPSPESSTPCQQTFPCMLYSMFGLAGTGGQKNPLCLHLVSITLMSRAPGVVLDLPSCSLVLPRSSHVTSSLMSPMSSPTSSRR